MPYPSGLSIFDPTDEQLAQYGYKRKLQPDEKIQWIGTPNRFWFWFGVARIMLYGGIAVFVITFGVLLLEIFTGFIEHNPHKSWLPLLPIFGAIGFMLPFLPFTLPMLLLSTQILYVISNQRIVFTTYNQEPMRGFGLFGLINRIFRDSGNGGVDIFYSSVSKIFTISVTQNISTFWFSDFVDLTGKPLGNDALNPERKYNLRWTGNTNAPFVISTKDFKVSSSGGLVDRFIAVKDGSKITELLEKNCALVKSTELR